MHKDLNVIYKINVLFDGTTGKNWECLRPHCRSRSIGPIVAVAGPTATDCVTVWRRGPELGARTRGTPEGG